MGWEAYGYWLFRHGLPGGNVCVPRGAVSNVGRVPPAKQIFRNGGLPRPTLTCHVGVRSSPQPTWLSFPRALWARESIWHLTFQLNMDSRLRGNDTSPKLKIFLSQPNNQANAVARRISLGYSPPLLLINALRARGGTGRQGYLSFS